MNDLLGPGDPPPVKQSGLALSAGPFVLVADHAGALVPEALGNLGLEAEHFARHIAIDLGSAALAEALAERLQAPLVQQAYSRLVVDCNRDPGNPTAMAEASDHTAIPGNLSLTQEHRKARIDAVFAPYHEAIAALLDARAEAGLETVLVSVHTFTPVLDGVARPWEIGVLHDGHRDGFSHAVLAGLRADGRFTIGDNQPYRMNEIDFTVPHHAFARQLPYLELEVRQDLLPGRMDEVLDLLCAVFRAAL